MDQIQTYGKQPRKKHKTHIWFFTTLIFLGIFSFLIYTSFYNPDLAKSITGNLIKSPSVDINDSSKIEARITIPEKLNIQTKIKKISLKIDQPSEIFIGNQKIKLSKKESIVIDNFKGQLETNEKTISKIKGKSTQVFINGLPILQKSGTEQDLELKETSYEYLELSEFFLNSLSYTTTGRININQNKIVLNFENEKIELNDFFGNLRINQNSLSLNGYIKNSEVDGLLRRGES